MAERRNDLVRDRASGAYGLHAVSGYHRAVHLITHVTRVIYAGAYRALQGLRALRASAVHFAGHLARAVGTKIADAASWGYHTASAAWDTGVSAGTRVAHAVTRWAAPYYQKAVHIVHTAAHAGVSFAKGFASLLTGVARGVVMGAIAQARGTVDNIGGCVTGSLGACAGVVNTVTGVSVAMQAAQAVMGGIAAAQSVYGNYAAGHYAYATGQLTAYAAIIAATKGDGLPADTAALSTTADSGLAAVAEDPALSCMLNSFTGSTKVLLPGGKTAAISKVKAGQKVMASDPYKHKTAARPVARVIIHHGLHAMAALTLAGGLIIHATAQHPIYDATTRTFTYAAGLHPGDRLLESSGHTIKITRNRPYTATLTAYNLDVTGIHTYYVVAGATAVLVHNSCGDATAPEGLSPELRALSEAHVTGSGDTVLGHFPEYITKAQHRGASYFDIGDAWDALSPSARTAANNNFLDVIAAQADRVLLSVPKGAIRSNSSLSDEVSYLTGQKGYQWVNQWSLRLGG